MILWLTADGETFRTDGSGASLWSRVFVYGSPKSAGALTGSDAQTTCLACHAELTAMRHAQNCDIRFQ